MVDIYTPLPVCLAVAMTVVYCYAQESRQKRAPLDSWGAYIPQDADVGTLKPCSDVIEYEFSHVCSHIYLSPSGRIDPRKEMTVGAHFSMPFDLDEGFTLLTLKVQGQPIYEDQLDFTCDMISTAATDYLPFIFQCPLSANTNITFSYTFTDVLGLKAYPGEYEIDIRLKNIDGYGVCCTTEITILG